MMALTDEQFSELLAQHDLVYDTPPLDWDTGIPLANGQIGALIWGDPAEAGLKITLDKYDCWELREQMPDPEVFNFANLRRMVEGHDEEKARWEFRDRWREPRALHPSRLPMPRLELHFAPPATGFHARLRLHEAIAEAELASSAGTVRWQAYVHAERNLLVMDLSCEAQAASPTISVSLDHLSEEAKETLRAWGYQPPERGQETDGSHWLRQRFPAGGEYVVAWRQVELAPHRELLLVSILSHRDADDPLADALALLREAAEDPEALLDEHAAWWREYWPASHLTIPDARLEGLFYVEMYKLGCSSRPGGLPISLQGLWSPDGEMPPWSGDYHLDSNVQESYWPIYAANRLELGECLYETFFECLPRWREQCESFFGFEGAWSGCAIAYNGARIYGYHGVEFWPGNGAWLAHHYWLHYLYSRDEAFLRDRAYPMMKAFMQTYVGLLEPGDDGRLHLPLGYSPEWGEGTTERYGPDPTCDLALIRWLAEALLEAVETLGLDEPEAEGWRDLLARLAEYAQGDDGLHVTAGQPLIHSHRHHSHLMAIHPLGVLNLDQGEEARALISRSLAHLIRTGMGQWAGHGLPPASLIASRAGLGNMAWVICRLYADAFITPNTFHVNGDYRRFGLSGFTNTPMTLEAGFGAAAAIVEMLLQSWGGVIRLFPTIPDRWSEAYFEDLRAEGAFLVTASLREGRVVFAGIESEVGGVCRLRNPWPGEGVTVSGPEGERALEGEVVAVGSGAQAPQGETIDWPTEPGGSYLVYPADAPPTPADLAPSLPERPESERNWFGLRRRPRF